MKRNFCILGMGSRGGGGVTPHATTLLAVFIVVTNTHTPRESEQREVHARQTNPTPFKESKTKNTPARSHSCTGTWQIRAGVANTFCPSGRWMSRGPRAVMRREVMPSGARRPAAFQAA